MGIPAPQAEKIFLELYEATTPTMATVAQAIVGMREKLRCDEVAERGVRQLWVKGTGVRPEEVGRVWGKEDRERKVGIGVVRGERRVKGGFADVVRKVMRGKGKKVPGREAGESKGRGVAY